MAKYFNIKDILEKSIKLYNSSKLFTYYIEDKEFFPYVIKLKRLKESDIQENYSFVIREANSISSPKFRLVYRDFHFKTIGTQSLPIEVVFESRDSFLEFIGRVDEFLSFVNSYEKIILAYPSLLELIAKKPKIVLQNLEIWDKLLLICDYFLANKKRDIYIRELAIEGVDTKFIQANKRTIDMLLSNILDENYYDKSVVTLSDYGFERKYFLKYPLPTIRFRILDERLKIINFSDISVTIEEFRELKIECKNVFIVENQITTLSFPDIENSIVIFGSGYGLKILKDVEWFRDKRLFYWGDIDIDGFAILSQARGYFSHIVSIFMNKEIVDRFSNFAVEDSRGLGTIKELDNLTHDEEELYKRLQDGFYGCRYRLEQERIPFWYVKKGLSLILD